jgi:hypothetical protein
MNSAPAQLKAGKRICGLNAGQKFALFAKSTVSPLTFLGAGASAGISQYNNDDAEWGQGAEAYGKRYAAAYTDRAAYAFFGKFFYPTIFRQDPRYFRAREDASTGQRFGHAFAHTFVTRTDAGRNMPNVSLWASAASTAALRNLYHPGNDRGFASAARTTGIYLGTSMGWDVLKEFWPGVSRTLHLPFQAR